MLWTVDLILLLPFASLRDSVGHGSGRLGGIGCWWSLLSFPLPCPQFSVSQAGTILCSAYPSLAEDTKKLQLHMQAMQLVNYDCFVPWRSRPHWSHCWHAAYVLLHLLNTGFLTYPRNSLAPGYNCLQHFPLHFLYLLNHNGLLRGLLLASLISII